MHISKTPGRGHEASPWCSDLRNSDELASFFSAPSFPLHCIWEDHSFSGCFSGSVSPQCFFLAEAAVGSSKRQENEPAVRQKRECSWQSSRKSRLMACCLEDSPHSLCYCHIEINDAFYFLNKLKSLPSSPLVHTHTDAPITQISVSLCTIQLQLTTSWSSYLWHWNRNSIWNRLSEKGRVLLYLTNQSLLVKQYQIISL